MSWDRGPGVIELPDGTRLRGRSLKREFSTEPPPEWGLYLLGSRPPIDGWPIRWVRWRDFWLPGDGRDAREAFERAHHLANMGLRVEVGCGGGKGRTGCALACIAQLGGVPAEESVDWIRRNYDRRAVETPWQRKYVRRFGETLATPTR
jgi:hypothetical protein